jgi:predicted DNA-binding protein with PD1-like motif
MHKQVVGRTGRVIVAHFDKDEDLLEGIRQVLKEQKIRTGYIPTITGAVRKARLQKFPAAPTPQPSPVVVELDGPLEANGSGIFGIVEAPEQGTKPFALSGNVHGEPYVHVHLTVTSAKETMSGHLMPGTTINSLHPISHFTIYIVEVLGAELQIRCDEEHGRMAYHFITETK